MTETFATLLKNIALTSLKLGLTSLKLGVVVAGEKLMQARQALKEGKAGQWLSGLYNRLARERAAREKQASSANKQEAASDEKSPPYTAKHSVTRKKFPARTSVVTH